MCALIFRCTRPPGICRCRCPLPSADGDAKKKKKGGAADGGDDAKEEIHVDATPKGAKKDMSRPMNEVCVIFIMFAFPCLESS